MAVNDCCFVGMCGAEYTEPEKDKTGEWWIRRCSSGKQHHSQILTAENGWLSLQRGKKSATCGLSPGDLAAQAAPPPPPPPVAAAAMVDADDPGMFMEKFCVGFWARHSKNGIRLPWMILEQEIALLELGAYFAHKEENPEQDFEELHMDQRAQYIEMKSGALERGLSKDENFKELAAANDLTNFMNRFYRAATLSCNWKAEPSRNQFAPIYNKEHSIVGCKNACLLNVIAMGCGHKNTDMLKTTSASNIDAVVDSCLHTGMNQQCPLVEFKQRISPGASVMHNIYELRLLMEDARMDEGLQMRMQPVAAFLKTEIRSLYFRGTKAETINHCRRSVRKVKGKGSIVWLDETSNRYCILLIDSEFHKEDYKWFQSRCAMGFFDPHNWSSSSNCIFMRADVADFWKMFEDECAATGHYPDSNQCNVLFFGELLEEGDYRSEWDSSDCPSECPGQEDSGCETDASTNSKDSVPPPLDIISSESESDHLPKHIPDSDSVSDVSSDDSEFRNEILDALQERLAGDNSAVAAQFAKARNARKFPTVEEYIADHPQHNLRILPQTGKYRCMKVPIYCGMCHHTFQAHKLSNAKYLVQHCEKTQMHVRKFRVARDNAAQVLPLGDHDPKPDGGSDSSVLANDDNAAFDDCDGLTAAPGQDFLCCKSPNSLINWFSMDSVVPSRPVLIAHEKENHMRMQAVADRNGKHGCQKRKLEGTPACTTCLAAANDTRIHRSACRMTYLTMAAHVFEKVVEDDKEGIEEALKGFENHDLNEDASVKADREEFVKKTPVEMMNELVDRLRIGQHFFKTTVAWDRFKSHCNCLFSMFRLQIKASGESKIAGEFVDSILSDDGKLMDLNAKVKEGKLRQSPVVEGVLLGISTLMQKRSKGDLRGRHKQITEEQMSRIAGAAAALADMDVESIFKVLGLSFHKGKRDNRDSSSHDLYDPFLAIDVEDLQANLKTLLDRIQGTVKLLPIGIVMDETYLWKKIDVYRYNDEFHKLGGYFSFDEKSNFAKLGRKDPVDEESRAAMTFDILVKSGWNATTFPLCTLPTSHKFLAKATMDIIMGRLIQAAMNQPTARFQFTSFDGHGCNLACNEYFLGLRQPPWPDTAILPSPVKDWPYGTLVSKHRSGIWFVIYASHDLEHLEKALWRGRKSHARTICLGDYGVDDTAWIRYGMPPFLLNSKDDQSTRNAALALKYTTPFQMNIIPWELTGSALMSLLSSMFWAAWMATDLSLQMRDFIGKFMGQLFRMFKLDAVKRDKGSSKKKRGRNFMAAATYRALQHSCGHLCNRGTYWTRPGTGETQTDPYGPELSKCIPRQQQERYCEFHFGKCRKKFQNRKMSAVDHNHAVRKLLQDAVKDMRGGFEEKDLVPEQPYSNDDWRRVHKMATNLADHVYCLCVKNAKKGAGLALLAVDDANECDGLEDSEAEDETCDKTHPGTGVQYNMYEEPVADEILLQEENEKVDANAPTDAEKLTHAGDRLALEKELENEEQADLKKLKADPHEDHPDASEGQDEEDEEEKSPLECKLEDLICRMQSARNVQEFLLSSTDVKMALVASFGVLQNSDLRYHATELNSRQSVVYNQWRHELAVERLEHGQRQSSTSSRNYNWMQVSQKAYKDLAAAHSIEFSDHGIDVPQIFFPGGVHPMHIDEVRNPFPDQMQICLRRHTSGDSDTLHPCAIMTVWQSANKSNPSSKQTASPVSVPYDRCSFVRVKDLVAEWDVSDRVGCKMTLSDKPCTVVSSTSVLVQLHADAAVRENGRSSWTFSRAAAKTFRQVCANDLTSTGLLSASPSVPPGSPTPPPWILDSFWEFDKEPAAAATPRWRYACTLEYQSPAYGYTKAVSDVMSDALSYVAQGAQSSVEHVSWALGFSSVYLVLAVVGQQHVQISRVKDLLKMAAAHAQKVGSACAEDARKILDDAFLHSSGHTFYIPIVNRIEIPKLSEASRMVSKSETPPQTLRPTSSEKTRTRTRGQERMSSAARAQSEKMSPSERSQRASHAASVRASLSSSDVRRGRAVHAALVRHGKDDKDENSRTLVRHGKDEKDDNSRTLVRHGKDEKDENS